MQDGKRVFRKILEICFKLIWHKILCVKHRNIMVKINIWVVIIIYNAFLSGKRIKEHRFKVNVWSHFCFVLAKLCLNNCTLFLSLTTQLNDTEDKQSYLPLHLAVLPLSRALFCTAAWLDKNLRLCICDYLLTFYSLAVL